MQDVQDVRNAGDLFTQCRRRYGLLPEEVLGLLGVANAEELEAGGWFEALERVDARLTLPSGRILRPASGQADLREALEEAERKAWESLDEHRFAEFAHWAEVWAQLAKISGEKWTNPFGAVAAVGRKRRSR